MKFKFRLEKVLAHKKVERDLAHRDYIEAKKNYENGVEALNNMRQEVLQARFFESHRVVAGGTTAEALKWSFFFIQGQEIRIDRQKKANRQLIQEMERKQEVLIEKAKEFKTFEKLKERALEKFKKALKKADTKFVDEIVVMSSTRRPQDG